MPAEPCSSVGLPFLQVFFYIDPEFATDPKMNGINIITLRWASTRHALPGWHAQWCADPIDIWPDTFVPKRPSALK